MSAAMTTLEDNEGQTSHSNSRHNLQLLNASIDEETESYLRVLFDGRVRYITVDGGLYEPDDLAFGPLLGSVLPSFPEGDWNIGHISRDTKTCQPHFAQMTKHFLRGISHTWHPFQAEHVALKNVATIRTNVHEVTYEHLQTSAMAKFAAFEWEIGYHDHETMAYQWLVSHDIGPKFLGHITEEGRVIGFLMEKITNFRHAEIEDIDICRDALAKLHGIGIKHGDVNKHNFLIHDGQATLIDFECAERCSDSSMLQEELDKLQVTLRDTSGIGGVTTLNDSDSEQ